MTQLGQFIPLDEFPETTLHQEIARRTALRALGVCDYCERSGNTTPCRFPERHNQARREPREMPTREEVHQAMKARSAELQSDPRATE